MTNARLEVVALYLFLIHWLLIGGWTAHPILYVSREISWKYLGARGDDGHRGEVVTRPLDRSLDTGQAYRRRPPEREIGNPPNVW